jgi:phenylacetyl-CoA:acceptor oxidoreductase subunit 2
VSYGPTPWLQQHWDARAAANFMLGGTGSGLMIAAALVAREQTAPAALSLVLVAAGLGAVWLEIGRKLRALHVFFNPFTSWMTRESFAALLLFALGISGLAFENRILLDAAALAALVFLWCQARILQASKGIPAWRAPEIVPLVIATGIAEGSGLALLFTAAPPALVLAALAVIARALALARYRRAVPVAALAPAARLLAWIGTVVALGLLVAAAVAPAVAPLAGIAALAAGWQLKFTLVTRAAFNQGFAIPRPPVRGIR